MENGKGKIGIGDYVVAGYSHFWLQTDELNRAIEQLKMELSDRSIEVWDCEQGGNDPLEALVKLREKGQPRSVLIAVNMGWSLVDDRGNMNTVLVQFLQNTAVEFRSKDKRKILVAISSGGPELLPKEIAREFVYLTLPLPDREEIKSKVDRLAETMRKKTWWVEPEDMDKVVDACRGMTIAEIENSLAYSAIKTFTFDPLLIKKQRAAFLEKVAGVKYVEYGKTFSMLQGYTTVKRFVKEIAPPTHPDAKGIMLLGPAGTGKTLFCEALQGEFGLFMLTAEMAEMTGSLVGETEAKVKAFIEAVIALAPCIVLVDEIEKGLAGLKGFGGYSGDSLNKKAMSQFLKFLQNRPRGVYIVATCNNIADLPPEYVRAERWDTAPFFIDLPNKEERATILKYYKKEYKVDGRLDQKDLDGWSGAEIKACCRLAFMGGVSLEKAAQFIVPISKTMEEDISALRKWAKGRTLPASEAAVESVGEGRDIELGDLMKMTAFK